MKKDEGWLEISDMDKFADYIRNIVYINFKEENDSEDIPEENAKKEQINYELDLDKDVDILTNEELLELNSVLAKKECEIIIKEVSKKLRNKKNKTIRYLINDKRLSKIIEDVNQRLVSNIIAGLVKKGLLESAFDNEQNDFVFWKKEINNGDSQTREL